MSSARRNVQSPPGDGRICSRGTAPWARFAGRGGVGQGFSPDRAKRVPGQRTKDRSSRRRPARSEAERAKTFPVSQAILSRVALSVSSKTEMSETLEPKTRETLRNYVREVKSLGNEAAKRARFAALIAELFPGTSAVTDYARGVEKLIRISRPAGDKKGFADAYYGNAIIEFEKSLSATLAEAQRQLREYVAGTWQKDKAPRSLLAIA